MKRKITEWLAFGLLVPIVAMFLFPLVLSFLNSFMPEADIALHYGTRLSLFDLTEGIREKYVSLSLIPRAVTAAQYRAVLIDQPSFLILLTNSLKLTVPVVAGNLIIALMGAYGFTVWKWKYKQAVFFAYIVVMMMPLQAVLVPNYIVADKLGLTQSYAAIILPGIFAPFGTFLLWQSMKSIPQAYYEAAQMDGAGPFYIFSRIVIPQMKSGIAALTMLTFIEYWNLVDQAVIFIKDYFKEPLSVYLSRMADGRIALIFAASCVYMYLPLWFLVIGQKDLEKGIELSGVK